MVWSARVGLELGRNAYWVGDMSLWCSKCVMSCLLMSESKTLPMMGRREMGL